MISWWFTWNFRLFFMG